MKAIEAIVRAPKAAAVVAALREASPPHDAGERFARGDIDEDGLAARMAARRASLEG